MLSRSTISLISGVLPSGTPVNGCRCPERGKPAWMKSARRGYSYGRIARSHCWSDRAFGLRVMRAFPAGRGLFSARARIFALAAFCGEGNHPVNRAVMAREEER